MLDLFEKMICGILKTHRYRAEHIRLMQNRLWLQPFMTPEIPAFLSLVYVAVCIFWRSCWSPYSGLWESIPYFW